MITPAISLNSMGNRLVELSPCDHGRYWRRSELIQRVHRQAPLIQKGSSSWTVESIPSTVATKALVTKGTTIADTAPEIQALLVSSKSMWHVVVSHMRQVKQGSTMPMQVLRKQDVLADVAKIRRASWRKLNVASDTTVHGGAAQWLQKTWHCVEVPRCRRSQWICEVAVPMIPELVELYPQSTSLIPPS